MHDRTAACWERSLILLGGLLTQDSVNMGRLEEYEVMKVCQPSRSSMQDAHIRTHVPTACWCPLQLLGIIHGDNRTIDFLQLLQFLQTNCAFLGGHHFLGATFLGSQGPQFSVEDKELLNLIETLSITQVQPIQLGVTFLKTQSSKLERFFSSKSFY